MYNLRLSFRISLVATLLVASVLVTSNRSAARDGMWIPSLLKQLNEADLHKMGLEIPVEQLYDGVNGGLNDAVVQFGGGCTGEIVSEKGLLFTNHHCGFGQIQSLSSLEHNYLEKGYWAKSIEEELPCPGLTVTFIREIREVTELFLTMFADGGTEAQRSSAVKSLTDSLEKSVSGNGRKALVRPFFGGNRYFLFLTETFRDVRLVGTPPLSVGNFGGETDNWVWPRHTGDFSVFRIYADKDNQPADYSKENLPYRPKRHLSINTEGVREGDFTLVYGFPGRTQQFLTSASIRMIEEQTNPNRIRLRDIRMELFQEAMHASDTVRLQYAGKFKSLANSYKRWKGELIGLRKEQVYDRKLETEAGVSGSARTVLEALNKAVDASAPYNRATDYYSEGFSAIELFALAAKLKPLIDLCSNGAPDEKKLRETTEKLTTDVEAFYKNFDLRLDRRVATAMLETCSRNLPDSLQPAFMKEYRKNPSAFIQRLYSRSLLTHPQQLIAFINDFAPGKAKTLLKDPAWQAQRELTEARAEKIDRPVNRHSESISKYQREWIAYLVASRKDGTIAPDANSTLRVSYGKVQGLQPKDGISYHWQTTADGLLEKSMSGDEDYALDSDLRKLIENKSFGKYGQDGKLPVAFIASNHTTGGNSGSPVLDAKGRLIGINFDRIWEGVMSDLYYDPSLSRNIAVDIRYVLFIIEQLGGCDRLIKEMGITD